jgi:hypothetical protein
LSRGVASDSEPFFRQQYVIIRIRRSIISSVLTTTYSIRSADFCASNHKGQCKLRADIDYQRVMSSKKKFLIKTTLIVNLQMVRERA